MTDLISDPQPEVDHRVLRLDQVVSIDELELEPGIFSEKLVQ